jgi:hypothetical protein
VISEIIKVHYFIQKHKKDVVKFDFLYDTIKSGNPGTAGYISDRKLLRRALMDM